MRYSLLLLLLVLFACQDGVKSTDTQEETPLDSISYDTPESDTEPASRSITPETKDVSSSDPLAQIKIQFQQTEEWLKAEQLKERTETYVCQDDPVEGSITHFTYDGKIVLVRHEQAQGDHYGLTTNFYLQDGEVYFVYHETGSWRFGGKMTTDEYGRETPGTVDEVEEHRFYLQNGKVFKQLEKFYTIESWEDEETKKPPNKEVNPIEDTEWIQEEIKDYLAFKMPC